MRILALTNLYPNPYQPGRATFNRQVIRSLSLRVTRSSIAEFSGLHRLWDMARASSERRISGEASIQAPTPASYRLAADR